MLMPTCGRLCAKCHLWPCAEAGRARPNVRKDQLERYAKMMKGKKAEARPKLREAIDR